MENGGEVPYWKDLIGEVGIKGSSDGPTFISFTGDHYAYECTGNPITKLYFTYHVNHDWLLGSDMYIHLHHGTNVNVSEIDLDKRTISWRIWAITAKRGEYFTTSIELSNIKYTYAADDRYRHIVTEIELSKAGGGTNVLDSNDIDIDSIILIRMERDKGIEGDTFGDNHFVFTVDIHYLGCRLGTILKDPPFITMSEPV
jgi:hypothetical protein